MKSLFSLLAAFLFAHGVQAQSSIEPAPAKLFATYLNVKEALVAGNAANAAAAADSFGRAANMVDYKLISEDNLRILIADAGRIAGSKKLEQQRAAFANLSTNMAAVAKVVKLSEGPVFVQYCPMRKSSWLSSGKGIRNPYYGNAMLTCGQVQSAIQ